MGAVPWHFLQLAGWFAANAVPCGRWHLPQDSCFETDVLCGARKLIGAVLF